MGLRAQVGWMVRGGTHTHAALQTLTHDLQALQEKVARLESAIHQLQLGQSDLRARQLDEFDRVRAAVSSATDDLAARVAAMHETLRAAGGD